MSKSLAASRSQRNGSSGQVSIFELPEAERQLLATLLEPSSKVSVAVPKSTEDAKVIEILHVCCNTLRAMERAEGKLVGIVGRVMIIIRNRPSIYKGLGFDSYEKFIRRYVEIKLGLSRSYLYRCTGTVERWPNLPLERYERIPMKNWETLNMFADSTHSDANKLLDMAEKMSISKFRNWAAVAGKIRQGDASGAYLSFGCSVYQKTLWEEFIRKPEVQGKVGSAAPGAILEALIQEFSGTYGI